MKTILQERYGHYVHIFTDGSKNPDNGKSSCAFYVPGSKTKVTKRNTGVRGCVSQRKNTNTTQANFSVNTGGTF